jgi:hypothetical protein
MIVFQAFLLFASSSIYQQVVNGIVYIEVDTNVIGSGFFIDDKTILTNYHVVEQGDSIRGTSKNGNVYFLSIDRVDEAKDVAFLKFVGGLKDKDIHLNFNSSPYQVGDKVYVLGHPLNQTFSFTDGIISKIFHEEDVEIIQTTAVVAPGSSGGPMLNEHGEIIGIIHSGMSVQGINFGTGSNSILNRPVVTTYSKLIEKMILQESKRIAYCRNRYAKYLREMDLDVNISKGKIRSIGIDQKVPARFSRCISEIIGEFNSKLNISKDFTSSHRLDFL